MASCWLFPGLLLAAAAAAIAAVVPQEHTVGVAPGSSVRVDCGGSSSASGGGGWNLLGMLSNLLLGDAEDENEDDSDESGEQRAGSEEDDYWWLDLDLLDGSSSSGEAARREPSLPGGVGMAPTAAAGVAAGAEANHSLSLPRDRRAAAAPSWSLGDIDVQGGKNWSVRVLNWVLVRRNPTTGQVEVKLQVPGLFSPAGGGGGGGDDDDVDYVDVSGGGREARSTRCAAGDAGLQEGCSRRAPSAEGSSRERQPAAA